MQEVRMWMWYLTFLVWTIHIVPILITFFPLFLLE